MDDDGGGRLLDGCHEKVGFGPFLAVGGCVSWCVLDLFVFALRRNHPPPSSSPAIAMATTTIVEELKELLLMREEELTRREEALVAREEKAGISGKALAEVSTALDTHQTKAKATQNEYLNKIHAHTTHAMHSLGLNKILGEKRVELDEREQDQGLHEAALEDVRTRGLNPRDHHDELMEFVALRRLLQGVEADRTIEAGRLATLVRDVSKVLEDLGMSLSPKIHAWSAMSWGQWT
jgi:hypothetical protein